MSQKEVKVSSKGGVTQGTAEKLHLVGTGRRSVAGLALPSISGLRTRGSRALPVRLDQVNQAGNQRQQLRVPIGVEAASHRALNAGSPEQSKAGTRLAFILI